ncbi:hypothetical protein D3C87_2055770 [compost metagenome]
MTFSILGFSLPTFWIGLVLIIIVLVGRERLPSWRRLLPGSARKRETRMQQAVAEESK